MKKVISGLRKISLITLTFCMTMGMVLTNVNAVEVELSVKDEITYNEDSTQATIHLDVAQSDETLEVKRVLDPEENEIGLDDLNYVVSQNGSYIFKVEYLAQEDEEVTTYEHIVEVTAITDVETASEEAQEGVSTADIGTRSLVLGDNQYIVYTLDELRTYVGVADATIYFGADIEWKSDTSSSNSMKFANGVTINGTDPQTGVRHKYKYDTGSGEYEGFQIREDGMTVTFSDIDIQGVGKYGVANAHDKLYATIIFHNVNFTSTNAQGFNAPKGGKIIMSGNTTWSQTGSNTYSEEFGEFTNLEFAPNSNVTINHASKQGVDYNSFFYASHSEHKHISITVGENATATIKSTKRIFSSNANGGTNTITVNEGGTLNIDQTDNTSNTTQIEKPANKSPIYIRVKSEGAFNFYSNTKSGYGMLNTNSDSAINVDEGGSIRLINYGQGGVIGANSANTYINLDSPKYAEFTSRANYPFELMNKAGGNVLVSNSVVEMSADLTGYNNLGYVHSAQMNHQSSSNELVGVNPSAWTGAYTYNAMRNGTKSYIFRAAQIEIQAPVKDVDSQVTVTTEPNAKVTITGTYADGSECVLTETADENGNVVFDLGDKTLQGNSQLDVKAVVNNDIELTGNSVTVEKTPIEEKVTISAEDAFIHRDDAKALTSVEDLITYNNATVTLFNGTEDTPSVTSADFDKINAGVIGVYNVDYSYELHGDTLTKTVKIIVHDGVPTPNGEYVLSASNALISQSEAKALATQEQTALKAINKAIVFNKAGEQFEATVATSAQDWLAITAGTVGSYRVIYTFGDGETYVQKIVQLTVYEDGGILSPDEDFVLHAYDASILKSEAEKLKNKEELISFNRAKVTLANGDIVEPSVKADEFDEIKNGTLGNYDVTYAYGTGSNKVEKPVLISVKKNGGIVAPDRSFVLYAKDGEITQTDAKTLTDETDVLTLVDAAVEYTNGDIEDPAITVSNFDKVQAGKHGNYTVTVSHDGVSKEVTLKVTQEFVTRHLFDYDSNGYVDLLDLNVFSSYLNKSVPVTTEALYLSDANGDGYIDLLDLNEISRYVSNPLLPLREVQIPIE